MAEVVNKIILTTCSWLFYVVKSIRTDKALCSSGNLSSGSLNFWDCSKTPSCSYPFVCLGSA